MIAWSKQDEGTFYHIFGAANRISKLMNVKETSLRNKLKTEERKTLKCTVALQILFIHNAL